jgi:hypothetical protein
MEHQKSRQAVRQALLGVGTALLIAAGPNLWIASQRADVASAPGIAAASHPQTTEKAISLVPEKPKAPAGASGVSSNAASGKDPSEKKKEPGKDLSALLTMEMETLMSEWSEWRSWEEASYLKLVTGASAHVVEGYQALMGKNLNPAGSSSGDSGRSAKEQRKEEEDWLRENLQPAEWAAWQEDLKSREAATLESMAEESLQTVSQLVALTTAQKEALYALAVTGSKEALAGDWSRSVQFGVGVAATEPAQAEEWYDESVRAVLTPEQLEVWEPSTVHTRSLPDQLSGAMAARLVEVMKEKGLAEIFGDALKEGAAEMKANLDAQQANPSAPETK